MYATAATQDRQAGMLPKGALSGSGFCMCMLHASLGGQKLHLRLNGLQLLGFRKVHRRAAIQLRTAAEDGKQAVADHCRTPLAFSLHLSHHQCGFGCCTMAREASIASSWQEAAANENMNKMLQSVGLWPFPSLQSFHKHGGCHAGAYSLP